MATSTPLVESLTAAAHAAIDALALVLCDEAEDNVQAVASGGRAAEAKDAVRFVGLPGCVDDGDDDDIEDDDGDDDDEYVPMPEPDEAPAPLPETQTAPA